MNRIQLCGISMLVCLVSAANASVFVPISQGDLNINGVNNAGTSDTGNGVPSIAGSRDEDRAVRGNNVGNLSGNPIRQSPAGADTNNYYDTGASPAGDLGLLIDLGQEITLAAIQLYGFNITDGGSLFHYRTLGNFTIWTATDPLAVTTAGGTLLVNDISKFTQQGGTQNLNGVPTTGDTYGETFLFNGESQPSDVGVAGVDGDAAATVVTGDAVNVRYLFLRNMFNQVGGPDTSLGEIRVYASVPEPATLGVLLTAALPLALRRGSRRAG